MESSSPGRKDRVSFAPSAKRTCPDSSCLRSVARWHRLLNRQKSGKVTFWEPSGISPFRQEEGMVENRRVYTITELLCTRELIEEGRAMNHCVGS